MLEETSQGESAPVRNDDKEKATKNKNSDLEEKDGH